ncbi:hypothetical protein [Oceanithermus sp.]|uniref:hypothetical protein n=1 Tax=Oceanithermus sp. TaxID=2268145 RepID=UPI00257A658F|nr:hypothetical protein [Oceanithermus sp.]
MLQKTKYTLFGIFLAALGLWGLAVTIPNSFSSGEVVSAAKMNENFQALKTAVDALEAKLSEVQAGQKALPSGMGVLAYASVSNAGNVGEHFPPGAFTVTRSGTGTYDISVSGIDLSNAIVLITTRNYPQPGVCNLGLQYSTGFPVECYTIDGSVTKADRPFRVVVLR